MGKFNNKIEKHLELSEIADILKEYREYYNVYRRLLVIHMVANGESIAKASESGPPRKPPTRPTTRVMEDMTVTVAPDSSVDRPR